MFRRWLLARFYGLYRLDRWLRLRLSSAGILVAVLFSVALIFGLDTRRTLAYQLASLGLALLLPAILGALFPRPRLSLARKLPRHATVGLPLGYTVRVQNDSRRRQSGLQLIESLQATPPSYESFLTTPAVARTKGGNPFDRFVGYPRWSVLMRHARGATVAEADIPEISPHGAVELKMRLFPERRGPVRFRDLHLARPDPLGLVRAISTHEKPDNLLVLPRCYPVQGIELPGTGSRPQNGLQPAPLRGESGEFMMVRDYRPGDSLRRIHWRSWARTGRPVVKEFEDLGGCRHALFLDTGGATSGENFEAAISVAASFVVTGLLELVCIGSTVYRMPRGAERGFLVRVMEALACVQSKAGPGGRSVPEDCVAEAGGWICVFPAWDEWHRNQVAKIAATGAGVLALPIVEGSRPQVDISGPRIRVAPLESGDIARALAELAGAGK